MSPLASWILFPLVVAGFVVTVALAIWFTLKVEDWILACFYEHRKRKAAAAREAFHGAQARVMGPYASKVVPFRRQG